MSLPPTHSDIEHNGTSASPHAFTLVELIVSIAILSVLIVVLLQVFNASVTGWQRSETRTDTFREARAALALMAQDISQTVAPTLFTPAGLGQQPMYPTLVLDRYYDPSDPSNNTNKDIAARQNDPFEQLHCLTLVPNATPSPLCAVSYFCRWVPFKNAGGAPDYSRGTYSLARRLVNSTNTFNRFKSATPTTPFVKPLDFIKLFIRVADSDDPKTKDPSVAIPDANDLASYLWDLQFRVDTNLQVPPTATGSAQTPAADHASPACFYALGAPYPNSLPTYVEIRFKALSANAGARLRGSATRADWTDPTKPLYRIVILPNSQQFVRRVPLNNIPAPTLN